MTTIHGETVKFHGDIIVTLEELARFAQGGPEAEFEFGGRKGLEALIHAKCVNLRQSMLACMADEGFR